MILEVQIFYPWTRGYPTNLKILEKFAPKIFVRGELKPQDNQSVAIVGSRNMSVYGKELAERFSGFLALRGVTVVSGLARGVDTVSHMAALEARGRTVAVLGSGVDVIYPPENLALSRKISENGAVISQFPLGTKPLPQNFLIRNKVIAALSKAVVVIEGARRSGTFSIASHAANLGREVFAVP